MQKEGKSQVKNIIRKKECQYWDLGRKKRKSDWKQTEEGESD
jgi:hypothetical protein